MSPEKFPPPKGRLPTLQNLAPHELAVDPKYQRRTDNPSSLALIKRIARSWDWRLCNPLTVSNRLDGLFVIDGQHRWEASKLRGDIAWLPCVVSSYGTAADEAAMFVAANRQRKGITKIEDFRAAVTSGDAQALAMQEAVDGAGLRVAASMNMNAWAPGDFAFLVALERAMKRAKKPEIVPEALSLIARAFAGQVLVHGSAMFNALVLIITARSDELDREALLRALHKFDAIGWNGLIPTNSGGDQRTSAMRQAVEKAYFEERGGEPFAPVPFSPASLGA